MDGHEAWAGGRLTIDLDALRANYALIAATVRPARAAAVVKADAYGLGAEQAAKALAGAGCRDFFVALLPEALDLKPHLPADARLFVLNGLQPGGEGACADAGVIPVLNSLEQARRWEGLARARGRRLPAALQVDSGMSRLGLSLDDVRALSVAADFFAEVEVALLMSHLACADAPAASANRDQLARFEAIADLLPPSIPRSIANSGGGFLPAAFHLDLVRPGLALYGAAPFPGLPRPLAPVVRLEARVVQLRTVPRGTGVGYGLTYVAQSERRLATISVGYADGWPRRLGDRAAGFVDGVRLPIVGRVSMDSMTLDVTDLPPQALADGDYVELIGPNEPLEAVAELAETIPYEILTGLGRRFSRTYLSQVAPAEAGA